VFFLALFIAAMPPPMAPMAQARTTDGQPLSGATADLFNAVAVNDMPGVKRALAAGADVGAKNADGKTAADLAVDRGHFIIAHFLLSQRKPTTRREAPKPPAPTPRRLAPQAPSSGTANTQAQAQSRFAAPPEKPDPAPGGEQPSLATALDGPRGLTPPPLKPKPGYKPKAHRFELPPRKPAQPLPDAVTVAETPGRGVADDGLPAPAGDAPAEVPADPLAELPAAPGDLPPGTEVLAEPSLEQLANSGTEAPVQPAPNAPVAAKPPPTSGQPLGPVGEFFQDLLNLVKPDTPDGQPAPSRPRAVAAAQPRTPAATAAAPRETAAADAQLAAELERAMGLEPAPAPGATAVPDTLPVPEEIAESAPKGGVKNEADLDELKELTDLMAEPAKPGGSGEAPMVRRIEPALPAVRRSVPAPKVAPEPAKPPAESTASRTLDRLEEMVAAKPKEDEFGLPAVEITEAPTTKSAEPDLPKVVKIDDGEPSLESLLGDVTENTAPARAGNPPETLEVLEPLPPAGEAGVPNLDDAPGPETPEKTLADDLPSEAAVASAPRAQPTAPVSATEVPSGRGKPRFMTTAERLRRLNEALSREVPLGSPQRQPVNLLDDKVTDFMITGVQSVQPRGQAKPPPSMLPTRPLTQRPMPSDRFIDRLERIRRESYADEPPEPVAQPAAPMAPSATPQLIARAPQQPMATVQPRMPRTQTAVPVTEQAPAMAPAEPAKEDTSALGKLVQFFKKAESRKDEAAMADAERQALRTRQQAYAKAPDEGPPKEALADPPPLAKEAIAATSEPQPGQTAGKMAPGFMQNLSRLFTDEKVAERGWAAEVDIQEPKTKPAAPAPVLRPVAPSRAPAEAPSLPTTPDPSAAAQTPLPPPTGPMPADAGSAWTTTVEMSTDTGEPMVLGVVKTPVPAVPANQAGAPARIAPAPSDDLPPAEGQVARLDDGLPPAPGDDLPPARGDALPPAQGEDLPPAQGEDLPPAQGEDLPPAQGEAPVRAARPQPAAPLPYSDPLRPPERQPARPMPQAPPLARVAELQPGPELASPAGRPTLRPDERLATGAMEPPPGQVPGDTSGNWKITKLAKTDAPLPMRQRNPRPELLSRTSLTGTVLTMGESVSLENSLPPGGGIDPGNSCVKKNRGTTLFCVEPVDWPEDIRPKFVVPTILYTGPMAIVRYDQGTASRLHALFPSNEFSAVSQYYQKRYGPPTEIWKRSIAPLAQPRRENPTLAWRNRDPRTNAVTILEVRQYDDTRGGFPDTQRGAVMLYLANSPSIFPQVSSHELMRLNREAATTPKPAADPNAAAPALPRTPNEG